MKHWIVGLALALAAAPAQGQDVLAMSASQYTDQEPERQYAVIGYAIGVTQNAPDADSRPLAECVRRRLAATSDDPFWTLAEELQDAAILAAFGSEGGVPVGVVFTRAIRAACD